MKRYKYIGLLLLAGLAAACQKDSWESAGDNYSTEAILFTSPYTVTRSPEMRYGDFNVGDQVGVLGYCKSENQGHDYSASDWDTKKPFAVPDVFYNQPLTYGGGGTWNYTWTGTGHIGGLHPWYENEDYTYAFFAYYPYAEVQASWGGESEGTIWGEDRREMGTIELSGENEKGDPTITYTLPHEGEDPRRSNLALNVVPDFMLAYNTENHTRSDGAVSLHFRHMLCAFEFEINNYNTEEVTINSLTFSGTNFYKSFSITGQNMDYAPGDGRYSGYFQLVADGSTVVCPAASEGEGGAIKPGNKKITVTPDGDDPIDLLFIPDENGKITEGECTVTVRIDRAGTERTQNLKEGMSFRPGVRSIFSINIIGDNFVIQVRSDNSWSDGGDSDINFD